MGGNLLFYLGAMDQLEVEELRTEAATLAQQVRTSILHLNNLRLLCELCEENDDKVQFVAMKETYQTLEYLMREKQEYSSAFIYKTPETAQAKSKKAKTGEDQQICEFLHLKYTDFIDILLKKHLGNSDSSFQIPALKMLLRFVLLEHQISVLPHKKTKDAAVFVPIFKASVDFIECIISTILGARYPQKALILMSHATLLEEIKVFFHEYDDLRFYMLQSIAKICRRKKTMLESNPPKDKELINKFVLNAFQLLHRIPVPEELSNFYIHSPEKFTIIQNPKKKEAESFAEMYQPATKRKRKDKETNDNFEDIIELGRVFKTEEHSTAFQNAWRDILRLPLSPLVYKQVLLDMPHHILPHFPNPELFGDFFTDAYNMGGMSSVLALQGLFVLVSKYNFQYEDLYKNLYALLQPSIFLVKYSGKFFELCRQFFASSYVPEYLCAAFCKRLIRLGLKAPAPSYLPVLALVHNLMASHPQLASLLHRPKKLSSNTALMVADTTQESESGEDPFDMEEKDPAKANAQQSSMWEVRALREHYYPVISRFCKTFEKPINEHRDLFNVTDFLHQTYESEFQSQITKKRKGKAVPLTYQSSGKLFSAEEHEECFPTWDFN